MSTININDLTLGQLKEIQGLANSAPDSSTAFEVGKAYYIRTATYHVLGRLKKIYTNELVLEDASWVADQGRFNESLKTGNLNEVEPFVSDAIVSRGGIIDATIWSHDLPTQVK